MRKKILLPIVIVTAVGLGLSSCLGTSDDRLKKLTARDYRQDMRDFVQNISTYAKEKKPNFIIIPQNGHELLTQDGTDNGKISLTYINAIDGIGREDLFYGYKEDNAATPENEQKAMLSFMDRAEQNGVEVLVTDYCWTPSFIDNSYNQNRARGYISFAAEKRGMDIIPHYPPNPFNTNTLDINSLAEAKNFLYLINLSGSFTHKEAFLQAMRNTNYDMLIIDLFFAGNEGLSHDEVESLKTKKNGATRLVIAYMSIGEAENYRYYWESEGQADPPSWLGDENPNWPGNYKVRYWEREWQRIIWGNNDSYLHMILDAGFDGVYLDLIDAFEYFEN